MLVTFVSPIAPIGAAIFMVDETHRIYAMDLFRELDVFQDHFEIVHTARQRDNVKVVIPEAHRDPRLEEFLQAIVHAVDDEGVAMNDGFLGRHILKNLTFTTFQEPSIAVFPQPLFPVHNQFAAQENFFRIARQLPAFVEIVIGALM